MARESKSAPLVIANPAFGESAPEQNAQATAKEQTARATTKPAEPNARRRARGVSSHSAKRLSAYSD
ncbi:MAG TPA: hypothetical protein VF779_00685 [Pyrinomonadaceae bacterium]